MLRLPGAMCPSDWQEARERACLDDTEPSIDFFLGHLGEGWEGWRDGHPLAAAFFTTVQGVALGPRAFEILTNLACTSSPQAIHAAVMRLASKEWAHFEGTELELAVVGACIHSDTQVVLRNSHMQGPDLELTLGNERILVECKALQHRDLDREVTDYMAKLVEATSPSRNIAAHVVLDGEAGDFVAIAPEALRFLGSLKAGQPVEERDFGPIKVVAGGAHFPITGRGIAVISRAERHGDLLDLVKVRKSVRSSSKQLANEGGIFIVGVRDLFCDGVRPMELAEHLKETMSPLPNVSGVMLVQRDFLAGGDPRFIRAPGFLAFWGSNERGLMTGALLADNPRAERPLSSAAAEKLIRMAPLL